MATKTDPSPDKPKTRRPQKQADNYDKPDLRQQLKQQITADDKGGKPGQWSARKAQLLTHEYEKAGGGYLSEERTDQQQHLAEWTDQAWQTADGKPAQRAGGTTRYLPKEAWAKLSPAEQKATNDKKQAGSKKGEQVVSNTKKAKSVRKKAED
ncbi:hypothetical protein GK091_25325 [Spirosoma agri]|uniref:DUF5872 domain-containing protein n=1 Tax=Spirosoma agri TaxID=1987381 RepID=A0A6M0IQ95_9BACT|nr:hypothetical protein [Spirosoma agri]NEU70224.1 hypothetical protein [Spirosoma agri]